MNLETVLRYSQAYNFWKWFAGRNKPEEGRIYLSQSRVYILPTRHGVVFGFALVLMLLGSINYNLSLGYVLTFLLAGMAVVSILHTFRNLAYLGITAGRVEPLFSGDTAQFTVNIENPRDEARRAVVLSCDGTSTTTTLRGRQVSSVEIAVRSTRRGWLALPRVTLETCYPLGLFRAWAYVQPAMKTLVYPRPDLSALPDPSAKPESGDSINAGVGTEDFAGLRDYQASDSPRHIAWKAVASRDILLTKAFMGRASRELLFDWNDIPRHLGLEARLSRLARWVLLAHESGLSWGLRIPGSDIAVGAGPAQLARCLQALALYDERLA
jgi:uncharacterized protein (DUF58 family)